MSGLVNEKTFSHMLAAFDKLCNLDVQKSFSSLNKFELEKKRFQILDLHLPLKKWQ